MTSFTISYVTPEEERKTGHRITVEPLADETDWQALVRVVENRGLKLLRASTSESGGAVQRSMERGPTAAADEPHGIE